MKEFWTSIANALSGENGPLYIALCAITGLTLGWQFLDKSYQAEWEGGKINPAGSAIIEPKDYTIPSLDTNDPYR